MAIIFGQCVSFGAASDPTSALIFIGDGGLEPTVRTMWPKQFDVELDHGLINTGQQFPVDTQGLGAAPIKGLPVLTYELCIFAPPDASDGEAFQYVRQQWNVLWSWIWETYAWDDIDDVSGQKGTLTVLDEFDPGVTWQATARMIKPGPWQLVKGQPHYLVVEIGFALLSEFEMVGEDL